MRLPALSALVVVLTACAASQPVSFPPFPPGYVGRDGALLQKDGRGPFFVLDTVIGPTGMELWLGVRPEFDVTPLHSARRLDVLHLPALGDDGVLILGDCSIDGIPDFEVVALAERPRTEEVTRIRRAWRADLSRGRFGSIATRGVTCWMAQPRYCAGADLSGIDSVAMARRCAALFVRKNWLTQANGGYPDQVMVDVGETAGSLDEVIRSRHALLEPEADQAWCRGDQCGATFRYLGREDCLSRLVTMDRDFAGLRLWHQDLKRAPGAECVPRRPLATIPPTLPDSAGVVSVSDGRATFIFPVIPDTAGEWPDFATTASSYEWQAIVAGGDSAWIVRAQIHRPTPVASAGSFRELVRRTFVGVDQISGGGRFREEVPQALVRAEGIAGRAVVELGDSATVRRLFRARPVVVRLSWCTPYGRCGDHRVTVRYGETT